MTLKSALKRVRSSQPINQISTSLLRGFSNATGWKPKGLISHLPRVGVIDVRLPNGHVMKMVSDGEDWIPTQLFWHGWLGYEPEVTSIFYKLTRDVRVVFDVGAYVGFFSLLAAIGQPQSRIIALEPLERIHSRLSRNVSLNGLNNIDCIQAAAGKERTQQEFYYPDDISPVASSLRSDLLLATMSAEKIKHVSVQVETLDDVAARLNLGPVDLIKMDTERTEHEVLEGSKVILERDRPAIICEVWPDANNSQLLESMLIPLGYRFYHLLPDGPQHSERIIGDVNALNYLFTTAR